MKRFTNAYAVFMVFAHESSPFRNARTFRFDMLYECEKYMVVGDRMCDLIMSMFEDDLFNPHQRDLLHGIQKYYFELLTTDVEKWQYVDFTAATGELPDGRTENHDGYKRPTTASGDLKPEYATRFPWQTKKACLTVAMGGFRPDTRVDFITNRGPNEPPVETDESRRRSERAMRYVVVHTKTCREKKVLLREVADMVIDMMEKQA